MVADRSGIGLHPNVVRLYDELSLGSSARAKAAQREVYDQFLPAQRRECEAD
jgi:hypothetical protein